jgi:hypothetical protein
MSEESLDDAKRYGMMKMHFDGYITDLENKILCEYKDFCRIFPLDKQTDKEWEAYSFWTGARRSGSLEKISYTQEGWKHD